MLRLLKHEDFAILLMSDLASQPNRMSLTRIGKKHGVSPLFLKKLARSLRQAGLIDSKEGIGGGYSLTRDPKLISILDIMKAVGGKKVGDADDAVCPVYKGCLPFAVKSTITKAMQECLQRISLFSLIHSL